MSRKEILLSGAGGQGVLFMGNIVSLSAIQTGKKVVTNPTYGAAVRGGEVKCGVVISDEEIYDPVVDDADIVIALNEASLKRFGFKVKEDGTLLCDASENAATITASFNKRFQLILIPFHDLGPERYYNMIAMGVLSKIDLDLNIDLLKGALVKEMERRGRENLLEENLKAIQAGSDWYLREKTIQK